MSGTISCGKCGRPILAGDAFQCTGCNLCYHASCWISTPRCSCGSTSNRVVHVSSNGTVKPQQATAQHTGRTNLNRYATETSSHNTSHHLQSSPIPTHSQRRTSQSTALSIPDEELECEHCLLPVDTLNAPCPFCGKMPRKMNQMTVRYDMLTYDDAPWGLRAISAINQASAVMSWFIAGCLVVPFVATGEIGALFAAAMFAGSGLLNWRLGTDLLKKKSWARTVQTIFAALSLFGFPFFTLWGALTLWGLHSSKAQEYYESEPLLPEKTD